MWQVFSTGNWKEAAFSSSTIFQENDLGFGPSSITIDRNTGEYIMESKKNTQVLRNGVYRLELVQNNPPKNSNYSTNQPFQNRLQNHPNS